MNVARDAAPRAGTAGTHARRAWFYRAIAELLSPTGGGPDVGALRSQLGALHCEGDLLSAQTELSTALKGVSAARLAGARGKWGALVDAVHHPCERRDGGAWQRACVVAGRQGLLTPLAELEVMGRLAGLTELAELEGDEGRARELRSLQRQLLSQHSGLCLETLGAHLAAQGDAVLAGVGRALERLIEGDVLHVGLA